MPSRTDGLCAACARSSSARAWRDWRRPARLARRGAAVRVIEARDRIGGRVYTYRKKPFAPFYVELGGEVINRDHKAIRDALVGDLDLELVRVLRRGFGAALGQRGRVRVFASQTPL